MRVTPIGSLLDKRVRRAVRPSGKNPKHLTAVRACPCLICGVETSRSEAAHIRMGSRDHNKMPAGIGQKPADKWTLPLCSWHHRDGPEAQHKGSERAFWQRHGIDPFGVAEALYSLSPNVGAMIIFIRMVRQKKAAREGGQSREER
jgi:hypothetical protein